LAAAVAAACLLLPRPAGGSPSFSRDHGARSLASVVRLSLAGGGRVGEAVRCYERALSACAARPRTSKALARQLFGAPPEAVRSTAAAAAACNAAARTHARTHARSSSSSGGGGAGWGVSHLSLMAGWL
jgi:hypothetical protein